MNKKILLIDDEQEFVSMVKVRLEANGFEVVTANDGQEGIVSAKTEKPDLIVMDIMMPNMNGGDAVRHLKEDPATAAIPVIFLTAALTKHEEEIGQQVNIDNTYYPAIAKPFDAHEFVNKVNELLTN